MEALQASLTDAQRRRQSKEPEDAVGLGLANSEESLEIIRDVGPTERIWSAGQGTRRELSGLSDQRATQKPRERLTPKKGTRSGWFAA
jgi:hypothetical protein